MTSLNDFYKLFGRDKIGKKKAERGKKAEYFEKLIFCKIDIFFVLLYKQNI